MIKIEVNKATAKVTAHIKKVMSQWKQWLL